MRRLLALLILVCAPAAAQEGVPLLYTRTDITLVRQALPALPWNPAEAAPTAEVTFDTEIRDGATLYNQQGWYNLTAPSSTGAIMLVFGAPVLAPIIPSSNYAALDILLIDKQGTVTQIFPKLKLSSLQEEIYPKEPIAAFLFLNGGSAETLGIVPGDYVKYALFKRPPKVVGAPTP